MWFYAVNGQHQGPFDETAFERMIAAGTITPGTHVWREGQANWLPLSQVRNGLGVCQLCCRAAGEDHLVELEGTKVCAACKPVAMQRIREGIAVISAEPRRRPVMVWIISLFYFITFPFAILSIALIHWMASGAFPMSEAQRHYFQSQTIFDYFLAAFGGVLNLAGAIYLFRLRRLAIYCFVAVLVLTPLNFAYQIIFKHWLDMMNSNPGGLIGGVIGAVFGIGINLAIVLYAWNLKAKDILR